MRISLYGKLLLTTLLLILPWLTSPDCILAADGVHPHRTVRIGWYPAPGLQDGTTVDSLSGFNYEYLRRIAQYANWDYEFIFDDFSTLEKELIDGHIDILGDIAKTEARMSRYNYCTYPSCYSHTLLLCRTSDERFAYNDYPNYEGMIVGNSGSAFRKSMMDHEALQHDFTIEYRDYPTDDAMLAALDRGDVDTALISDAIQHKSYKILHEWEPAAQYFIVNKERTDILHELNAAMESLQASDNAIQAHLFEKYFGGDNNALTIALSREEMAAVASAPVLKVLLAQDQKPLSYVEDQEIKGFIPNYLELLSKKTGLKFTYIMCQDYDEMRQRFENGEGDICGQLYENYDTKGYYKVIQPFAALSCGLIYNPSVVRTIRTVAVEKSNSVLIANLEKMGFKTVTYSTPKDCLDAVNTRQVDAASMPSNVFEQIAYHEPYLHLMYKAQSNLNLNLCIGVAATGGHPFLFRILSKSTGSISPSTITHLMLASTSLKPQYTLEDYLRHNIIFINIILGLLAIILFLGLWYRRQRRFNACLLQATEAKNVFFNNLSHDLRTPLTGILGYSELAIQSDDTAKKHDYLHKIHKSGTLLLNLINDTLSLARIERGQFTLSLSLIAAKNFFDTLIIPLQSQIQQKHQTFDYRFNIPAGEYISADKLKLQDMLLNILSNAVKYTPEKGRIEFYVEALHTPAQTYQYHITIRDNGIGISDEFLKHLFEPFMQERDERAEGVPRTGLGMAIVKRIIDLMQGDITVQSVKNQGTKVEIFLPVQVAEKEAAQEQEALTTEAASTAGLLRGTRILLCEDNMLNREIISEILSSRGILVDTAENGQKGLELFSREKPGTYQAILMDIRMPVMDGYQTTARIRARKDSYSQTIPILALSADAYEESIQKSLDSGMTDHLTKPIENTKLFQSLQKYILPLK